MGRVLMVNQDEPCEKVLAEATTVLQSGGVLVMPTDSVYGIGCAATPGNTAHARIFNIKRRDRTQTLPWLVAAPSDLLAYASHVPAWAQSLARDFWPGALTLVVHASSAVPAEYQAADGTIALRVPNSNLVRELCRRVGPLATTSANTHGETAATSGSGVEKRIVDAADLTLDAGPAPIAVASTIVGCLGNDPVIFREGALSSKSIRACCERTERDQP